MDFTLTYFHVFQFQMRRKILKTAKPNEFMRNSFSSYILSIFKKKHNYIENDIAVQ